MGRLGRLGLAVAVLLLALGLVLAALLPRLADRARIESGIRDAVADATGRTPAWETAELAWLPPRLVLRDARLPGEDAAAPSLFEADRIDVSLGIASLLGGRVAVRNVAVAGGTLRPVGWLAPEAERDAAALAITELEGEADGVGGSSPARVSGSGRLAQGSLEVGGRVARDGGIDLTATLAGVDLAALSPALGGGLSLAGRVDGSVHARGPAAAPESVEIVLDAADATVRAGEIAAQGPVGLRVDLHGPFDAMVGSFELDATRATLEAYGGAFRKPPGAPATTTGKLVRDAKGRLDADSVRLRIQNMDGALRTTPEGVVLDAPAVALETLRTLVPALEPLAPEGPVAFEGVGVTRDPLALRGRVRLDGVMLRPAGRRAIVLRGALAGDGAGFASERLVATLAGATLPLRLEVHDLDTKPRFRFEARAEDVEAGAIAGAVTGDADAIEGPLDVDLAVGGPLGAGALEALEGTLAMDIGKGRIPGVSPLGSALDALAAYPAAAEVIDHEDARESLTPYLGDRFESFDARFAIAGGRARSQRLLLRYPGYDVALRGSVGLADQDLDGKGRIVLGEEIEAALAGRPAQADADARAIDVARLGGTLARPALGVDAAGALAFAGTFALAQRRDTLERKLDRALGDGAGEDILDALDGLFGRKEKR